MLCVNYRKQMECVPGSIFKYKDHFCTCKGCPAASKDKSEFYKSNKATPQRSSNSEEASTSVISKTSHYHRHEKHTLSLTE